MTEQDSVKTLKKLGYSQQDIDSYFFKEGSPEISKEKRIEMFNKLDNADNNFSENRLCSGYPLEIK